MLPTCRGAVYGARWPIGVVPLRRDGKRGGDAHCREATHTVGGRLEGRPSTLVCARHHRSHTIARRRRILVWWGHDEAGRCCRRAGAPFTAPAGQSAWFHYGVMGSGEATHTVGR